jgi:hypothetical protein
VKGIAEPLWLDVAQRLGPPQYWLAEVRIHIFRL